MRKLNNDVYYDELIALISGNMNISTQYVIFTTSEDEYYGINVAKVEELIQNKNIDIIKSTDGDMLTLGVAKIRENMSVFLNFDDWIGIEVDEECLDLVILCKYSSSRIGLVVKNVIGIQQVEMDALFNGTQRDTKITYAVEITVNGEKKMCNIFDFDKLTTDIYPNILKMNETLVEEMQVETKAFTHKTILVAEDSILIQEQMKALLHKMNIEFLFFENGQKLLDKLVGIDVSEISLIITDIEMPVLDGIELIKKLKADENLSTIPLIAHTNMSNSAIAENINKLGVLDIVNKLDLNLLKIAIEKFAR